MICTGRLGYSLLVVMLIVALIAILGMLGVQGMFNKTIKDTKEKDIYITKTAEIAEDHDNAPLAKAVREDNIAKVELILRRGTNPNACTSSGSTVLHRAAAYGLVNVAKLLIEYGADINVENPESNTPLHLAASNGFPEVVRLFIDQDAKLNLKNDNGDTPLEMALRGLSRSSESTDQSKHSRYEQVIKLFNSKGLK